MLIPPTRFFITKKIYHSLFVARTWQHFIEFTAFLDSNAYIKLAPNGAGPVRRLPQALGNGAGPAATGRAGDVALWARPPAGQAVALRAAGRAVASPRLLPYWCCEKTLTYLRRAYVSVYRYSLEVFPVISLE